MDSEPLAKIKLGKGEGALVPSKRIKEFAEISEDLLDGMDISRRIEVLTDASQPIDGSTLAMRIKKGDPAEVVAILHRFRSSKGDLPDVTVLFLFDWMVDNSNLDGIAQIATQTQSPAVARDLLEHEQVLLIALKHVRPGLHSVELQRLKRLAEK